MALSSSSKESPTSLRAGLLACVSEMPGGMDAMAAALGMSRDGLSNRIYERKGQGLLLETAMQLQATSGSTALAKAVAHLSGGVFVPLPDTDACRDDLLGKFNELYSKLGELSSVFREATGDGEIDARERRTLEAEAQRIHALVEQLLALSFSVYCRGPAVQGAD